MNLAAKVMTKADSFSGKGHFMLQQLLRDSVAGSATERQWRYGGGSPDTKRGENAARSASKALLESINARRSRGESFASIAAVLNKQGISGAYGGRWYASSVSAYLQRRLQTGSDHHGVLKAGCICQTP